MMALLVSTRLLVLLVGSGMVMIEFAAAAEAMDDLQHWSRGFCFPIAQHLPIVPGWPRR